jgi:predicted metal-dependent peptidase
MADKKKVPSLADMKEAEAALDEAIKDLKEKQKPLDPQLVDASAKKLERIVCYLVIQFHFVHQILGLMRRQATNIIDTMGVRATADGWYELSYNPAFVMKYSDSVIVYILYHEVMHAVLHHCTTRQFDNKELGNIAHDLAVNELIPVTAGSCEPPIENGRRMGVFADDLKKTPIFKDIENKKSSEWYYEYLKTKCPPQSKNGQGKGDGKGKGQSGLGHGLGDKENKLDSHDGWSEEHEIAAERMRAKINQVAKSASWGNISAGDQEMILAAQVRKINWRNLLRKFYGNYIWPESEATRKRPNRRTGLIHPGTKKTSVDRHLVAIDTSGSVDSDLLAQFLSTINQMTDYVPIDLMQFDWDKTEDPKPFDMRRKNYAFKGRGGTSFDPVMKTVKERRYKSVVILTDGQAAAPEKPKAAVVWVLPMGCQPPVDWGLRVHMTRTA